MNEHAYPRILRFLTHCHGSYAPFSDLFRYELQRRDLGMWIDCDVYCVRAFAFEQPYVFGWQTPDALGNAVLRLPSGSKLAGDLIALFDKRSTIYPWLSSAEQKRWLERKWAGESFDWTDLPWAATGPSALTYLVRELGLTGHALRPSVLYPLPLRDAAQLLRAGADLIPYIAPGDALRSPLEQCPASSRHQGPARVAD